MAIALATCFRGGLNHCLFRHGDRRRYGFRRGMLRRYPVGAFSFACFSRRPGLVLLRLNGRRFIWRRRGGSSRFRGCRRFLWCGFGSGRKRRIMHLRAFFRAAFHFLQCAFKLRRHHPPQAAALEFQDGKDVAFVLPAAFQVMDDLSHRARLCKSVLLEDVEDAVVVARYIRRMNRPKKLGGNPICERIFP